MRLDHLLSKEEEVVVCVLLFSYQEITEKFPVAMRFGDTPVPIPNTTVKTEAADDTMLETAWESRWLPDPLKKGSGKRAYEDRTAPRGVTYISGETLFG